MHAITLQSPLDLVTTASPSDTWPGSSALADLLGRMADGQCLPRSAMSSALSVVGIDAERAIIGALASGLFEEDTLEGVDVIGLTEAGVVAVLTGLATL